MSEYDKIIGRLQIAEQNIYDYFEHDKSDNLSFIDLLDDYLSVFWGRTLQ